MSNYHVLSTDAYGNSHRAVFHVSVPDTQNSAGVSYREALVEFMGGSGNISSVVPFIDAGELTLLENGELYEMEKVFYSNPGESLLDKRNRLDAMYAEVVTEVQYLVQTRLDLWGYSRDVT